MNGWELYRLDCSHCGHAIELPSTAGIQRCPNCHTPLFIEWHGGRVDYQPSQETPTAS